MIWCWCATAEAKCRRVCVCDSFSVPENVLEQLQKMYGGKTLKWVIGSVEFLRWKQEKEEAK